MLFVDKNVIFWRFLIYFDFFQDDEDDADGQILSSDEDEIDEESAVYLESLQDKLNKHCNGNLSVSLFFVIFLFINKVYIFWEGHNIF